MKQPMAMLIFCSPDLGCEFAFCCWGPAGFVHIDILVGKSVGQNSEQVAQSIVDGVPDDPLDESNRQQHAVQGKKQIDCCCFRLFLIVLR